MPWNPAGSAWNVGLAVVFGDVNVLESIKSTPNKDECNPDTTARAAPVPSTWYPEREVAAVHWQNIRGRDAHECEHCHMSIR